MRPKPRQTRRPPPFRPLPLQVLHEDNHLLVVFKPAGLLSQADRTGDPCLLDLARAWLVERHAKPGGAFVATVHRLDRPVAGVMVLAKSTKCARRLAAQFRERAVTKTYRAVVHGRLSPPAGVRRDLLARHWSHRRGIQAELAEPESEGARWCELEYRTIESRGPYSLVEITPRTGRGHQIRAQLAGAGHPILGDTKYGSPEPLPGRTIALLAARLELEHPTREERLAFESPVPEGWPWPPPRRPSRPPRSGPPRRRRRTQKPVRRS